MKISKVTVGNGLDGFKFYGGDAKFTLIAESVPELTELNAFIELINSLSNKKVEAGLETSYGIFDLVLIDLISNYFFILFCVLFIFTWNTSSDFISIKEYEHYYFYFSINVI